MKYIDDVSGHEIDERRELPPPLGWTVCDFITAATLVGAVLCAVFGWLP